MKSKDRVAKNRLTDEIVLDARRRLHEGLVAVWELAAEYEVSYNALRKAVKGRKWTRLNHLVPPVKQNLTYGRRGVFHPGVTLTDDVVLEARRLIRSGATYEAVIGDSGISLTALRQAVQGSNWAHLDAIEAPVIRHRTFTAEDMPEILRRADAGERHADIAADYGMSRSAISHRIRQARATLTD